jgi:hypothetical protein
MARNPLVLPLLAGLVSCAVVGPDEVRLAVETDRSEYLLDLESGLTTVQLTLRNQGSQPLYLAGCPGVPSLIAEQQEDGVWQQEFQVNVVCQAIYTPSYLELLPDQSHTSSLSWRASGTYRLRVPYGAMRDDTWGRSSTTATFVVR